MRAAGSPALTQVAPRHWRRRAVLVDVAVVVAILLTWLGFALVVTDGELGAPYDAFRDMAYAENILAGRLWDDPTIPNQPYWYAPGSPLLVAAVSAVTGFSVVELYGTSLFWLSWLNPVCLFLLVRIVWGRTTALVTLPMVWLGSYWWFTHAAAAMPSVQGIALNLMCLMCWHKCLQSRCLWPIITGVCLSISAWHHPLCATVLSGSIFFHAVIWALDPRSKQAITPLQPAGRMTLVYRMIIVAVVGSLLSSPLILHLASLPILNRAPFEWFAPELHQLSYAAHAHVPLVPVLGLLGAVIVLLTMPERAWLVGYAISGLLGQAVGYAAHDLSVPIPYLIPHEFQWHEQLALTMCAAVATVWLAARAAHRIQRPILRRFAEVACVTAICLATLAPVLRFAPKFDRHFIRFSHLGESSVELTEWMRSNTSLDATVACPTMFGYLVVAGMTGRKCVAVSAGHLNPGVDAQRRTDDLHRMLNTTDEETFTALAARYGTTHLIILLESRDQVQRAKQLYSSWSCLDLQYTTDDRLGLVYRIAQRAPSGDVGMGSAKRRGFTVSLLPPTGSLDRYGENACRVKMEPSGLEPSISRSRSGALSGFGKGVASRGLQTVQVSLFRPASGGSKTAEPRQEDRICPFRRLRCLVSVDIIPRNLWAEEA